MYAKDKTMYERTIRVKKIIGICMITLLWFSGCSMNKPVDTQDLLDMFEEMGAQFAFIKQSECYQSTVSNTLVVQYLVDEAPTSKELSWCFEATRKWLVEDGYLDKIEASIGSQIKTLRIQFESESRKETYVASYYKSGLEGKQDGRFGRSEAIDGFSKWSHEIIYK